MKTTTHPATYAEQDALRRDERDEYAWAPRKLNHDGQVYRLTGKLGRILVDGEPSAEYATEDDDRVILTAGGTIIPD